MLLSRESRSRLLTGIYAKGDKGQSQEGERAPGRREDADDPDRKAAEGKEALQAEQALASFRGSPSVCRCAGQPGSFLAVP
jgi:hypothetical protein